MLSLIRTLNGRLGDASLDERAMDRSFNTFWPQFEKDFRAALDKTPLVKVRQSRSEKDILEEILQNSRSLNQRVATLTTKRTPEASLLKVIAAQYGAEGKFYEVTDLLNASVVNDRLELFILNHTLGGDPAFGKEKELTVEYWYSGKRLSKTVKEGEKLMLP